MKIEQSHVDTQYMLKQLSLRQEDTDTQVLQALQQAIDALMQAQKYMVTDRQYHQKLRQSGNYEPLKDYSPAAGKEDGTIPPWLLGNPPYLQ